MLISKQIFPGESSKLFVLSGPSIVWHRNRKTYLPQNCLSRGQEGRLGSVLNISSRFVKKIIHIYIYISLEKVWENNYLQIKGGYLWAEGLPV